MLFLKWYFRNSTNAIPEIPRKDSAALLVRKDSYHSIGLVSVDKTSANYESANSVLTQSGKRAPVVYANSNENSSLESNIYANSSSVSKEH